MQKLGKLDCIPPPRPKRRSKNPYPKNRGEAKKREAAAAGNQERQGKDRQQGTGGGAGNTWSSGVSGEMVKQVLSPSSSSSVFTVPQSVTPSVQWSMLEQQQSKELQHKQLSQAQLELQQAISDAVTQAEPRQGNGKRGSEFPPRFSKVYSFLGSLFDPSTTGHLDELEKMTQVDREIIQVLMRNLASNLEEHIKIAGGAKGGGKSEGSQMMSLAGGIARSSKASLKTPAQSNLDKLPHSNLPAPYQ
eukprot:297592-Amorphochlora_amoeboformis.AAC.1